jgi:hypothetical protein
MPISASIRAAILAYTLDLRAEAGRQAIRELSRSFITDCFAPPSVGLPLIGCQALRRRVSDEYLQDDRIEALTALNPLGRLTPVLPKARLPSGDRHRMASMTFGDRVLLTPPVASSVDVVHSIAGLSSSPDGIHAVSRGFFARAGGNPWGRGLLIEHLMAAGVPLDGHGPEDY